jgi:hypothetical protein
MLVNQSETLAFSVYVGFELDFVLEHTGVLVRRQPKVVGSDVERLAAAASIVNWASLDRRPGGLST